MADIDISALCALAGQAVADLVEAVDAGACPTVSRKATFGQIVDVITGDITVNACGVSALAACSVAAAEITNCTVGTAELAACSVTATEIAACAVGTSEIAANGVDTAELAASAVETAKINNCAVTVAKMAANSVDSAQYVDASIDTIHIADDQITLGKMATGTDGNLISYDACTNPAFVATGTCGQVLTSNGAGAAPTFQAAGGGSACFTFVTKACDQTINCDSTLTNDCCLKFAVAACSTYFFIGGVLISGGACADFKYTFTVPTNATMRWFEDKDSATGSTSKAAAAVETINATNDCTFTGQPPWGFVTTGACAGCVNFQWAQNSSNAQNTILRATSFLMARKQS